MEYLKMTVSELAQGLRNKDFSCEEMIQTFLSYAQQRNTELNAVVTFFADEALAQARDIDQKLAANEHLPQLAGIPFYAKDNLMVAGHKMTAGSKMLADYESTYTATAVQALLDQGAILLGKANMDEFAMGSSSESSYFGPVLNPHDSTCVAGGSSGGSAVVVADNQAPFSLGSDTGGSIRQPASFCGVVGLKPTYGGVSRYGVSAMASSFDQIGPFAQTVADTALVFNTISLRDEKDSTSVGNAIQWDGASSLKGKKIGIVRDMFADGLDEGTHYYANKTLKDLEEAGAELVDIELPHLKYALPVYYILMPAEVSSNLARLDGVRYGHKADGKDLVETYEQTRAQGFGDEVTRRILMGTFVLSHGYSDAYYHQALKVRRIIHDEMKAVLQEVDAILTPTTPTTAFKVGEKVNDPLAMYKADIFTVGVNVVGVPALVVPVGKDANGLPVGMQLIADHYDEATLFTLGSALENIVTQ